MSAGGMTIARDVSWVINTAQGQLTISADFITNFEAKPDAKVGKNLGVSGIITPYPVHEGHSIEMEITRTNDLLETYWALSEAAFYAGVDVPGGTIYETITEVDGSVSQHVYTNVQLKVDTFGMKKGNELVSQKLSGFATRFEKIT